MLPIGVVTFVTMDRQREGEVTVGPWRTNIGKYAIMFDRGFELKHREEDPALWGNLTETSRVWGAVLSLEDYQKYVDEGRIKEAEQMPPESDETKPVPPGQTDPISLNLITDGMEMATFNNEYGHRYYEYQTVGKLMERGLPGAAGEPVRKVKSYTAKIEGKTRVTFEGKPYDLVVISPGKYQLEDYKGTAVKEYNDTTLDTAPLTYIGGGRRRKSRRSKKRRASRRAKKHTRRSRS
jgi:hypothetical protein